MDRAPHARSLADTYAALNTGATGLSGEEAVRRLATYGPNELRDARRRGVIRIALDQFGDAMILILLGAVIVSFVFGDAVDTISILAIIILNAVIGFVQEFRAEKAMTALKRLAAPSAVVLREGSYRTIPSSQIVPGDIVSLNAGATVPADLRLVESANLRIDESAMTGESATVVKDVATVLAHDAPLGERPNMAYAGTQVTMGRAVGIAVATGMSTELGRIATLVGEADEMKTPLQRRLAGFGRRLSIGAIMICVLLFVVGTLRGEDPSLMFMTALTLVVAAIPEALPAVVTISLALAARTMAGRNALVRRLAAVETLGSVTTICTDKTGTLTVNRMTVESLWMPDSDITKGDTGFRGESASFTRLMEAMALSNDVLPSSDGSLLGDPTEIALYQAATASGFDVASLSASMPRVAELPFDSERRRMSTIHRDGSGCIIFTKGGLDAILSCIRDDGDTRAAATAAGELLAVEGSRVIAFAYRTADRMPDVIDGSIEQDMTFLGVAGLVDPPRPEAHDAVERCMAAGITPVMITGDHPLTALAIARRTGIATGAAGDVVTGAEIAALPAEERDRITSRARVFARVAPEQKFAIVSSLQRQGRFVAMTGDGVNDAPALKQADIGVAMGVTGTDTAREAADMVLLDDNFATIIRAVEEGRRIYDGILKMVRYILSTNTGEISLIFLAPLIGLPLPLLPIQILWLNLVTDGLPSLAFAVSPAEPDLMRRPPHPPEAGILDATMLRTIGFVGFVLAAGGLILQGITHTACPAASQTMVFTFMCIAELGAALAMTSERRSLFSMPPGGLSAMYGAAAVTLALQLCIIYIPLCNRLFRTVPLTAGELAVTLAASTVVLVSIEIAKLVKSKRVL